MILLFKLIILTSIWVLGLTIATQKGMVLYKWRHWGEKMVDAGNIWAEPLIVCQWCMPSMHSTIGYAFAIALGVIDKFSWSLVFIYPLVVMGSSLVCGLTWAWYNKIKNETLYFEHAEAVMHFEKKDRIQKHNYKKQNGRSTRNSTTGV